MEYFKRLLHRHNNTMKENPLSLLFLGMYFMLYWAGTAGLTFSSNEWASLAIRLAIGFGATYAVYLTYCAILAYLEKNNRQVE